MHNKKQRFSTFSVGENEIAQATKESDAQEKLFVATTKANLLASAFKLKSELS